jgi:hypothetical protein
LHHIPCHENTTERKDPKFESHHYRKKKSEARKKKKKEKKSLEGRGIASAHKARMHTQKSQHYLRSDDENRASSLKGRL